MTDYMQNIADYWSDWTLDAVATSSQDRRLNEDAPEYDEALAESLKANAYKAIMNALKQAALEYAGRVVEHAESPEDRFNHYMSTAIARSPAPVQELGEYLADVLFEDNWPTAEKLLNQICTQQPAPAVPEGFRYVQITAPSAYTEYINLFWGDTVLACVPPPAATEIKRAIDAAPRGSQ